MTGHIRQRGSSWELKYDLARGPDCERRTRTETYRGGRKGAERRLRELLAAVDKDEHIDRSQVTVAAHVAERIALWRASGRIGAKSAERAGELLKYQLARISELPIQKLRTVDIEQWHAALLTSGIAPCTIRDAHGLLTRCLDEAVKHGLVSRNACRLQRPPRVPRSEIQIVASEEIGPMLDKLEDGPFSVAVIVALYCGLRRGEQLALTGAMWISTPRRCGSSAL
jgi:integrase